MNQMNFWAFLSLIVCLVFVLAMTLLIIRVQDQRETHRENVIINQATADRVSQEAMTVLTQNNRLQEKAFEYATQQAKFAQEVMQLVQAGQWGGDVKAIEAAVIRQLDGVAPPHNAPKIAIRRDTPRAAWPDGTTYESRLL